MIAGVGVGLRAAHLRQILAERPPIPWLEILIDNHRAEAGPIAYGLDAVCAAYPTTFHTTGLDVGSTDPLDRAWLRRLRELADRHRPAMVSTHLCWTGAGGVQSHDLLPLPRTPGVVRHVAARVRAIQDALGRRLDLENASAYAGFAEDTIPAPDFLGAVAEAADCGILLDVNNVYVSCHNLGGDPDAYLAALPAERVHQLHIAGHTRAGSILIDTHGAPVIEPVWDLLARTCERLGPLPLALERDRDVPPLEALLAEAAIARQICDRHS